MASKHTHQGNRVYTVAYHIVWCPKYRRKVLIGDVRARLDELIRERVEALGGTVGALECMPDHVHLFCRMSPNHAPHYIVNMVKGYTSRVLRQEFPHLRRLPSLWTRSYFLGTTGHVSSDVVRDYIERQTGQR